MFRTSARVVALASLSFGAAAVALAADDPRTWLERMGHAIATRNYQGTFVHEHGGQTDTLHVVHCVRDSGVAERIQAMDGSGREFVRRDGQLRTYFPDQRVVLVESTPQEGLLLTELLQLNMVAPQLYRLSEAPQARVSGRTAHVIDVQPQDELRYGYRVWIDEATAMPLKTQLRTPNGAVVEELVFTELTLPAQIDERALEAQVDVRGWRWVRHDSAVRVVGPGAPAVTWQSEQLPAGFHMTARSTRMLPGARSAVTHLVFSDGLATVSVFVEQPEPAAAAPSGRGGPAHAPPTMTTLGSSAAYSTFVDGHKVIAIGEVPAVTVRAIAGSLRAGNAAADRPRDGGQH